MFYALFERTCVQFGVSAYGILFQMLILQLG